MWKSRHFPLRTLLINFRVYDELSYCQFLGAYSRMLPCIPGSMANFLLYIAWRNRDEFRASSYVIKIYAGLPN